LIFAEPLGIDARGRVWAATPSCGLPFGVTLGSRKPNGDRSIMPQLDVNTYLAQTPLPDQTEIRCYVYHENSDTLAALYSDPYLRHLVANPLVGTATEPFDQAYVLDGSYSIKLFDQRDKRLAELDDLVLTTPIASPFVHQFKSVDAVFKDTLLSYAPTGAQHSAVAGHTVYAQLESLSYTVAPAAANDHAIETAGGVKLYIADPNIIDVRAFNPDPDADAATELQAAINLWIERLEAQIPCMLRIPCTYSFQTGLVFAFTKNIFIGGALDMRGGQLVSDLQTPGTAISFTTVAGVRNLSFYDFHIRGSANDTVTVLIDGGSPSSTPQQFVYNWQFYSPKIEDAPVVGMKWTGNYFESQMFGPWIICNSLAPDTYGCWLEDTNTANPSSMDIYGGSMRGGTHALFSDHVSDVKIFGGTYLNSGNECIAMLSNIAGGINGAHIENAYDGNPGTGQAGVLMTNSGYAHDLYGTSNNGNNDTLMEVFSAGLGIEISGLRMTGGVSEALIVRSGSQRLKLYGVPRNLISFADIHAERGTGFSDRGRIKRVPSASGTQTIDIAEHDWYDATLVGNVSLAAPSNPVAGDELLVTLQQGTSGGNSVTWSSAYLVKTPIDTGASKRTAWTFRYTGGAWLEVSALAGL